MGTAYYADLRWSLVPKLQLGNPEGEALASRNGKLELPNLIRRIFIAIADEHYRSHSENFVRHQIP